MRWEGSRTGLLLLALACLGGCEYQDVIDSNPESVQIVLSPASATLEALGDTIRIAAEVSVDGVPVPGAPLSWRSLDPGIATVDRNGRVEAVHPGTARIEVSVSSRSETATITVRQKVVSLFVIPLGAEPGGGPPPGDAVVVIGGVGDTLRFAAVARDRNGNEVADLTVEWSSLDPSVAAVNQEGVVRGVGNGMTQIVARAGEVADSVSVLVQQEVATLALEPELGTLNAIGDTLRLAAVARDGSGNVVRDAVIAWKSLSPDIVSIDDNGLATARKNGQARIVALTAGAADTATVVVDQRPAAVTVAPSSVTVTLGSTEQLTATVTDANGHAIAGASVSWSSSNTAVATVNSSGVVRGVATGTATVTARSGNMTASASVTVSAVPVGSVTVSPAEASVPAGTTVQLAAEVKDAGGNVLNDRAVNWSSSDTAVATVSASGLVTGVATGTATITAASGDKSGSAKVTVTPSQSSAVARVEISPSADTLDALGAKVQFAATAYDGDGAPVTGARITWASLNPNIATVDSMGNVTAKAVGAALIVAAAPCCGKADTAGVVVRQVVASVSVSPSSRSIAVAESYRLSAGAEDANGNPVPNATFVWTSSNNSVATVDGTGLVTGVSSGSATITATSGDKKASAQINVTGGGGGGDASLVNECSRPQSAWIWCDDFDQDRIGQYFEYDSRGDRFVRATGVGIGGSGGMRARFNAGDVNAGSLKLAFGKTPGSYFRPVDSGTANYRDVYWRFYLRNAPGWTGGGGDKLARAIIFAGSNWSEALIAHVWSGGSGGNYLVIDPASGTDAQGNLRTTKYNDFANLRWLGARTGSTPIFDAAHVGQWYCIETRVRVNDPGQSNGVFELWVDGELEARATNLNWVGSYSAYGINALLLENYWNNGSPRQQERYFDNLVVSTQRVGCGDHNPGGGDGGDNGGGDNGGSNPPAPVATVTVSPSSAPVEVGRTLQLTATLKDQNGNTLGGRTITWTSTNTSVATVTSDGLVRGMAVGTATIRATSEGKTGQATITVTQPPPPSQGGDPRPGSSDRILFDTRTSLQNATTAQQALAGYDYVRGIQFSRNFNGQGTNAYRIEYRGWGGTCAEQSNFLEKTFAGTQLGFSPRRVYMQWKMRMGRHPADANTSHGAVNSFAITNGSCGTGGNAGRKMMIMVRGDPATGNHAGNAGRTDVIWGGPAPSRFSVAVDTKNLRKYGDWYPESHIAEDLTITVYYQAASSPSASDGRIMAWVNGVKILDTSAPMDVHGFHGFHLPSVFNAPRQDQVEYIWDIVVWTPE